MSRFEQKRRFQHASIRNAPATAREFSSTAVFKEPSRSPPELTVAELVRKLKIEGQPTSGRLRVRTAKAILRTFEKFLNKQKTKHKAVMSAIRQRDCQLMSVRFRTIMITVADLIKEADDVLHNIKRGMLKRIPSKERGKSKKERLERNAAKREKKKVLEAQRIAQKENRAMKRAKTRAVSYTTTGAPIRNFVSFGMSTSYEIDKTLQAAVFQVSRLTEEARFIMATLQQSKPHVRRMPVSKLATTQALNQTLGYAIEEIIHLTEETRSIMATLQRRKRQRAWRFIRRWGRNTIFIFLGPRSSPADLLITARRMLREYRIGIKPLKSMIKIIQRSVRRRKFLQRKSVNESPRVVQTPRLRVRRASLRIVHGPRRRVRRISPRTVRVVRYPSRGWIVRKKPVSATRKRPFAFSTRSSGQQQSMLDKRRKRDELAATVLSWLSGSGSSSDEKSGLDALLATAENQESKNGRFGRRRRR